VRTATDFCRVGRTSHGRERLVEATYGSLTPAQLDLLLGSVAEAQWMSNLLYWKKNEQPHPTELSLDQSDRLSVVPTLDAARPHHPPAAATDLPA